MLTNAMHLKHFFKNNNSVNQQEPVKTTTNNQDLCRPAQTNIDQHKKPKNAPPISILYYIINYLYLIIKEFFIFRGEIQLSSTKIF